LIRRLILPWALALTLATAGNAHAVSAIDRTFAELVQRAELIVAATVAEVRATSDGPQAPIFTHVTLTGLEPLKGAVEGDVYVLRISGGVLGDRAELIAGLPRLVPGQRYILFIRGNGSDVFPLVGIHSGLYRLVWDAALGSEVVRTARGGDLSGASLAPHAFPAKARADEGPLTRERFVDAILRQLEAAP